MRTLGTAALVTVLGLTASCGQPGDDASSDSATAATSDTSSPTAWGSCTAADLDDAEGPRHKVTAEDGTLSVTVVTGEGPCAGGLVAEGPAGITGLDVSGLDLDPATAEVVDLADGQLVRVDSEGHPRGGFQPHLFALTADGPVEVMLEGSPLVPFVATDGGALPMTTTCPGSGGVGVLSATVSKPPGVILAWDVQQTTYDVGSGAAEQTSDEQIEDHAADPLLRRDRPELFDSQALFAGCSTPFG